MYTGISKILFHKIIHSLLALPVYASQSIYGPILEIKKCDISPSIYGTHCQYIFTNILMADKHNIPKGKINNCRLLPDHIVCKMTQRHYMRRTNTCDPALKLLNEEITSDIQKPIEGTLRCTLGPQAKHAHSLEDHTRSIQQSTSTHTQHLHNIQQQNNNQNILRIVSPDNSQTLSHSPLLRSKRQ